jgi:wobble nucleotide-excising tRNase
MSKEPIRENTRYKQGITQITLTEATFANSPAKMRTIEPTWINFFFGNNGSGKTTISRTIRNCGNGVMFEDGKTADDYNIAVYNQDFVTNDLSLDSLPGVFMLGEENIDDRKQLDGKTEERRQLEEQARKTDGERQAKATERDKKHNSFVADVWKTAAKFKQVFGGSGNLRTKELCVDTVLKINPTVAPDYSFEQLQAEFATANSDAKEFELFLPLNLDKLEDVETYPLLKQRITSTADSSFARFMQSLGAVKWVDDGRRLYAPKADGKCPYCRQPLKGLNKDIQKEIEACFDEQYDEDCRKIADYVHKYAEYIDVFIDTVKRYIANLPQTGYGDKGEYERQLELLVKTLEINKGKLAEKVAKPSEEIVLETTRPYLVALNALIQETNSAFQKENEIIRNKGKAREACLDKIWPLLVWEVREIKKTYLAAAENLGREIKDLEQKLSKEQREIGVLKNEITRLSEKLGGNALPVEVINSLLSKSGFRGFQLANHNRIPDKYVVIRQDGSEAKNLSEGERNFIAFLYFYHLVHGSWKKEDLDKPKLVVIDDPVSSMDSGVLFIVGLLVRKFIEDCFCDGKDHNIKQIFVLTHNPYFHKAVSHKYETNQEELVQKSAFYAVKKSEDNISTVRICENETGANEINALNVSPVKNSYDALWCEYRDVQLPSTLLSIIRRIVEYHFLQLCSYSIDHLRLTVKSFIGDNEQEQRLADEMLQYIYDDLHDIADGIYFTPNSETSDYKKVFAKVFEAMGQKTHYQKMSAAENE